MQTVPTHGYRPRVVDAQIDEEFAALPAIVFEGAKGVGKTASAERRAHTVRKLDDPAQVAIARAAPERLLKGTPPVLIDEWQYVPESWDLVRRAVDAGAPAGSYLLTGSALPKRRGTHSGAGRIVTLRMRPLSLFERELAAPAVSLAELLRGGVPKIEGTCTCDLEMYVREILASGFPGLRALTGRALRAQLESYLQRIVDREFAELGHSVRNPETLRRWMRAYAAASSTTTAFEKIRDAASGDQRQPPARTTVIPYRDVLERLWILDPVPPWLPSRSHLSRLSVPPKHQLADPALAAQLLGVDAAALMENTAGSPFQTRDGTLLGALFESLVTLSVRVYAQAAEAHVKHLRTARGEREVDLIVERADGRVVAIEVKLARTPSDGDAKRLNALRDAVGGELLDRVIVNTGPHAYRRPDGVAVIPAALLGP